MATGKVKNVTDKGFGFIQTNDADKDVFYHERSLEGALATRKLRAGDNVTFDIMRTDKGLNASNIQLVEEQA